MSGIREHAVRLLAQALQLDSSAVDDSTALGVSPQWDSLAHLRLVLALEEQLGRQLTPQAIVALNNLEDIVALLKSEQHIM